MDSCKPTRTPCKPHTQVLASEGTPLSDSTMYKSLVGALEYLTLTRLDLAYAINLACQYMTTPIDLSFGLVEKILRYV